MEFKNDVQKACYAKVLRWMKRLFGTAYLYVRDDVPLMNLRTGLYL